MAVSLRLEVRGQQRLEAGLARLRQPQLDAVLGAGLLGAGRVLQRAVQTGQLRGQALPRITGELHDSIELDRSRLPRSVLVGSALRQAGALEYGWAAKNIPAFRYFERAVDAVGNRLAEPFLDAVDEALADEGWRVGRP